MVEFIDTEEKFLGVDLEAGVDLNDFLLAVNMLLMNDEDEKSSGNEDVR